MTTHERIDQLEDRVKVLTHALKTLIKEVRSSPPSLEYDCDGEINGVSVDLDFSLMYELEKSLSEE